MYNFKMKDVMDAVENSNGTYSSVARRLKVRSVITARRYINKWKATREVFYKIQDNMVDTAEDVLMENLTSDNPHVRQRAAEVVLKNMPRSPWREGNEGGAQDKMLDILSKMVDNTNPVQKKRKKG